MLDRAFICCKILSLFWKCLDSLRRFIAMPVFQNCYHTNGLSCLAVLPADLRTRVTNLRGKKFRATCFRFTSFHPPETTAASGAWARTGTYVKKSWIVAHHRKVKKSLSTYYYIFRTYRLYKSIIMLTIWFAYILRNWVQAQVAQVVFYTTTENRQHWPYI
jgi:hypothetical protein